MTVYRMVMYDPVLPIFVSILVIAAIMACLMIVVCGAKYLVSK